MKKIIFTGNRTGDILLAGFFALAIGVGVLTTSLLWKYDLGSDDVVTSEVPVTKEIRTGIVVMGDSLAQGVGASSPDATLAALLYARRSDESQVLWNFGWAGSKVEQVNKEQVQRLLAVKPSAIYLIVGANDVTAQTDPAQFKKAYSTLLDTLSSYDVPVVVLNIPKLSVTPAVPQAQKEEAEKRTLKLNGAITDAVTGKPNVTLVDMYAFSEKELIPNSGLLSGDNFHPNNAGYARMAEVVLATK